MVLPLVFRFESFGEEGIPFPSIVDAMREAPSHAEARIATSIDGVVLCEAQPATRARKNAAPRYTWQATVAGSDVLEGAVRGMPVAS